MVSVHLGDRPNVAAIKNGLAMDSSIGFTPAEGLPSSECCGDIDPAVVLHLKRAGWPIDEINDTLARHSGFSGMTATPTRYCDLVSRSGDVLTSEALEMLAYGVRKYIGAFAAAMGGVDSVVFSGRDIVESVPLARRVFRALGFPGLRVGGPPVLFKDAWSLSHRESTVRGLAVEYNKWQVLEEMVRSWLE